MERFIQNLDLQQSLVQKRSLVFLIVILDHNELLIPFTPIFEELLLLVFKETDILFDFCLVNYYRNGLDKVSWHKDKESMMDCSNIVSLSFGAARKFQIRDYKTKAKVWEKELESGSMLWMKPGFQEVYQHQVPIQSKVKEPRINLTFRLFKASFKK
jgi:alkylated DNA repair dioxygenase AlkB